MIMLILVARLSKTLCCTLPVAGTGNRELKFLTPYLVLKYLGWEYRLSGLSHRKLCLTSLINVDMQIMMDMLVDHILDSAEECQTNDIHVYLES